MTKRYRLIRDIDFPIESIPKGTLFERGENEIYYSAKGYRANFNREEILDKKWFTEIKEEEPIMVREIDNGKLEFISENRTITCKIKELWNYLYCNNPISQKSWSDNDMIQYAIWYYIDSPNLKGSDVEMLEIWKSKNRK